MCDALLVRGHHPCSPENVYSCLPCQAGPTKDTNTCHGESRQLPWSINTCTQHTHTLCRVSMRLHMPIRNHGLPTSYKRSVTVEQTLQQLLHKPSTLSGTLSDRTYKHVCILCQTQLASHLLSDTKVRMRLGRAAIPCLHTALLVRAIGPEKLMHLEHMLTAAAAQPVRLVGDTTACCDCHEEPHGAAVVASPLPL